jgi:hypothetical protein
MSIVDPVRYSYNNLKIFNSAHDHIRLAENQVEEYFSYFDYYEEYDNKEYEIKKYKKNYCGIERTYINALVFVHVGQLAGVEYIIAKEQFCKIELDELKNFCPCINCHKKEIHVPNLFKMGFKSGAWCLKNGIKNAPLIQEARKLKEQLLLR